MLLYLDVKYILSKENSERTRFCATPHFNWNKVTKEVVRIPNRSPKEDTAYGYVKTWKLDETFKLDDLYERHKDGYVVLLEAGDYADGVVHEEIDGIISIETNGRVRVEVMN